MNGAPPIAFTVVAWEPVNQAELYTTTNLANSLQRHFRFSETPISIPEPGEKYRVSGSGFDLDRAASNLLRRVAFRHLLAQELILVTGNPYSDPYPDPAPADPLDDFYFTSFRFVSGSTASIISTYIWEKLPLSMKIEALRGFRYRLLQPYILMSLAGIVLAKLIDMPNHAEARGCINDYCAHARDIDRFFIDKIGLCEECEAMLDSAGQSGDMALTHYLPSVRRLINRALGR